MTSEAFEHIFDSGSGGILRECDCGVVHYNEDDAPYFDDGELEKLRKWTKENHLKYVAHDHTIGTMLIDGREFVYDCGCRTAQKYENFIINHDRQLAEYLNQRAKTLRENADNIEVK